MSSPTWATEGTETITDREDRTHPQDRGVHFGREVATWVHYSESLRGTTIGVELSGFRHDAAEDFADSVLVWESDSDDMKMQRLCLLAEDARRLGEQLVRAADMLDGRKVNEQQ